MPKRPTHKRRGLGASEYAHARMAGQKLLDLETNLANAERASGCNALFTAYQAGLDDWSSMDAHLRSGVSKGEHSALYSGLESARKRLVKLDGRIRKCFCTK